MLDLTVGTEVTELRNLNAMGQVVPRVVAAKREHSTTKGKVDMVTTMDSRIKAAVRSLINTGLWQWLVEHVVPRNKTGSLLNSYLICISRKVLC